MFTTRFEAHQADVEANPSFGGQVDFFLEVKSNGPDIHFEQKLGGTNQQGICDRLIGVREQLAYAARETVKVAEFNFKIQGGPCHLHFADKNKIALALKFISDIVEKLETKTMTKTLAHLVLEVAMGNSDYHHFPMHFAAFSKNEIRLRECLRDHKGSLESFKGLEPEKYEQEKSAFGTALIAYQQACDRVVLRIRALLDEASGLDVGKLDRVLREKGSVSTEVVSCFQEKLDSDPAFCQGTHARNLCAEHDIINCRRAFEHARDRLHQKRPHTNFHWLPTPLKLAAFVGYERGVEMLLQQGAKCHKASNDVGFDAGQIAENAGYPALATFIRDYQLGIVDVEGYAPLHRAVFREDEEGISYLLSCGVDVDVVDAHTQRTALQIAANMGSVLMVQRLLEEGKADCSKALGGTLPARDIALASGAQAIVQAIDAHKVRLAARRF